MGLDMYLDKYPRHKDTTPDQIDILQSHFDLKERQANGEYLNCSLEEWCGIDESKIPDPGTVNFYRTHYKHRYSADDTEHRFGYMRISQNISYWRKANQIHYWFVCNVQNGEDDCGNYVVSKEDIEDLLHVCKKVKERVVLVPGKVSNGYRFTADGGKEYIYVDGLVVKNPEVCEELLPSQDGFFFGGTDYDSYYMDDINRTIEQLEKVLKETDFENEVVYYCASW